MKFICFGYLDEKQWDARSDSDRASFMQRCLEYDDELRRNGHFLGAEALQSARNTATIQIRNGHVSVTDGPYSEAKEQIGGILILEARDLNHAIQLISHHPGVQVGAFEIRLADEEINSLSSP